MISRLSFLLMLLSSSSSPAVEAFSSMVHQQPTTVTTKTQRSQTHLLAASRRDILSVGVSAALSLAVAGSPLPASADISEGNTLPQGAQQFSRLIRVKADLKVS